MASELREAVRGSGGAGIQRKPGTIKTREGTTRNPEFERAHPRAPEGRTGGGRFITAGSKGPAAQAVKQKLGNLSDERIRRFQRRRGLVVDGKIGHQTAAALAGEKNAAKVKIGRLTDEDRKKLRRLKVEEAVSIGPAIGTIGSGGAALKGRGGRSIDFDPRLHPRNRIGEFRDVLGKLKSGDTLHLPGQWVIDKIGPNYIMSNRDRPGAGEAVRTVRKGKAAKQALQKMGVAEEAEEAEGWAKVAERTARAMESHRTERAARRAAETPEQRGRRKRGEEYARELTQLARRTGAPMPILMQQSRALVAWRAAFDARENGNEELALQHAETAVRLEATEANFRPEQLRDKWGRWRTDLRAQALEMERKAMRRTKVRRTPLLGGPDAPRIGSQLLGLAEASPPDIRFDPRKHPRNRVGEFIEVLGGLTNNQTVELPGGTNVTKRVQVGERSGTPYEHFDIKRPGVKRPWKRTTATAAADVVAEELPELKSEGGAQGDTPDMARAGKLKLGRVQAVIDRPIELDRRTYHRGKAPPEGRLFDPGKPREVEAPRTREYDVGGGWSIDPDVEDPREPGGGYAVKHNGQTVFVARDEGKAEEYIELQRAGATPAQIEQKFTQSANLKGARKVRNVVLSGEEVEARRQRSRGRGRPLTKQESGELKRHTLEQRRKERRTESPDLTGSQMYAQGVRERAKRPSPAAMAAAELGEPVEGETPATGASAVRSSDIAGLAQMIRRDWAKVNFAAVPYLDAMGSLSSVDDRYFQDPGREIVQRFLGNAGSWRGPTAKAVKAELRRRLKEAAYEPIARKAAIAARDARANGNLELAEAYERRAAQSIALEA